MRPLPYGMEKVTALLSHIRVGNARTMAKAADQELFKSYLPEVVQTTLGCGSPDLA